MKEQEVQKTILDYLKYQKIFCWKHNSSGIMKPNGQYIPAGLTGICDILGILPDGKFLGIEVKKDDRSRPTPNQCKFIANILANEGVAFIACSIEDVTNNLKRHGY